MTTLRRCADGLRIAGTGCLPLEKAERILSLDSDIFSSFNVGHIKGFGAGRKFSNEKTEINRLYCVETTISLTGAKADHRIAVKPSQFGEVAKAIAKATGVAGANSTYTENAQWIAAMAKDLMEHRGRSLVIAGDNQSPMVHALAHAINAALGNAGQTVTYMTRFTGTERTQIEQLRDDGDIDGGRVRCSSSSAENPVYNTPADLKLNSERMLKLHVGWTVHIGEHSTKPQSCANARFGKHYSRVGASQGIRRNGSITQPLTQRCTTT